MADTEKGKEPVVDRQLPEETPGRLLIRAAKIVGEARGKQTKSYAALAAEARAMAARLDEL